YKGVSHWLFDDIDYNSLNEEGKNQYDDRYDAVQRTNNWYKSREPLVFITQEKKSAIQHVDVVFDIWNSPIVSKKVLDIMLDLCPDDFETYPFIILTEDNQQVEMFLINITHLIKNAVDPEFSIIDWWDFKMPYSEDSAQRFEPLILKKNCLKEHHIGRLYESKNKIMVSRTLMNAFKASGINALEYITLDKDVNEYYYSQEDIRSDRISNPPQDSQPQYAK
ncbi:MAG: hypothetical protein HRT90_08145, partial [Candidatus Margulisbacteria bacterium]|nr:hypothetical protein [Candidatus Margulisiibacteriota bacterium]